MSRRVASTIILCILLMAVCYWYVDIPVMKYFGANQMWDAPADFISAVGRYYDIGIGLILAGWFWCHRRSVMRRRQALFFTVCWAASNGAGSILKFLCGRYRPKMLTSQDLYGFHGFGTNHGTSSFPSGHTLDAVTIAATLWILWPRSRPWCAAWAAAMGLSRIIVRAHYVSDVLAGALLGFVCVYFINKRLKPERLPQP
ncbi:MAG: phosphatase PAP2 family protein [Kiritimatiellales bacterium]|jgi:membrane-associated phospholipid phosphatase